VWWVRYLKNNTLNPFHLKILAGLLLYSGNIIDSGQRRNRGCAKTRFSVHRRSSVSANGTWLCVRMKQKGCDHEPISAAIAATPLVRSSRVLTSGGDNWNKIERIIKKQILAHNRSIGRINQLNNFIINDYLTHYFLLVYNQFIVPCHFFSTNLCATMASAGPGVGPAILADGLTALSAKVRGWHCICCQPLPNSEPAQRRFWALAAAGIDDADGMGEHKTQMVSERKGQSLIASGRYTKSGLKHSGCDRIAVDDTGFGVWQQAFRVHPAAVGCSLYQAAASGQRSAERFSLDRKAKAYENVSAELS